MPRLDPFASRSARPAALAALLLFLAQGACDKRTAEEKGRDFAAKKVGFAQGAASVLEEKGKILGASAGKGVADLVKGAGSAAKDVMYAKVKVTPAPELTAAGLKVLQAHEGEPGSSAPKVTLTLEFSTAYAGRLQLRAFASDDENKEAARSSPTKNVTQAAGSTLNLSLAFPADTRLSKMGHYLLAGLPPKTASLAPALKASGIELDQLDEDPNRVSLYLVFKRPYQGGLQLRAYAADRELGRSEATAKLSQERDSAAHMAFAFDEKTPLGDAASYVLHKAEPKAAPKSK